MTIEQLTTILEACNKNGVKNDELAIELFELLECEPAFINNNKGYRALSEHIKLNNSPEIFSLWLY